MRWTSRLLVLALLAASSASPAAAHMQKTVSSELHPDPDSPVPFVYVVPCLVLDVGVRSQDGAETRVERDVLPEACNWPKVVAHWDATPFEGHGSVTFAFDTAALEPQDEAPRLEVSSAQGASSGPAGRAPSKGSSDGGSVPRSQVVVAAAFDVAWGGDCRDARGAFAANVDGTPVAAEAPADLFRDLCTLSTGSSETLLRQVLAAAASVGASLGPSVAVPGFGDVVDGLARVGAPAPPETSLARVSGSDPASSEERGTGDATVALLSPEGPVQASHDVSLSTPVADVSSSDRIPAPSETSASVSAASAEDARLSPVRASPEDAPPRPPPAVATAVPGPAASAPPAAEADGHAPPLLRPPGPRREGIAASEAGAAGIALAALVASALALYHRFGRSDALAHPARAALHRACTELARPATVLELAHLAGMPRKTAEYHLLYLTRLGLLRLDAPPEAPHRFGLPNGPPRATTVSLSEALLARLRASPGASTSELAEALGVNRLRVDRRVKDLLLEGVLVSRVEKGRRLLYPA